MAHRTIHMVSKALDGVHFQVRSIERSEEPYGFYRFDVELTIAGKHVTSLNGREHSLLRSRVTFLFEEAGAELSREHGMITARSLVQRADLDGLSLGLTIRPRVWVMTSTLATETFRDLTVPEILARKLGAAGLEEGGDFVFNLRAEHRVRQVEARLGESDLDFMTRLCGDQGIQLSFEHGGERDVLVFSDAAGAPRLPASR